MYFVRVGEFGRERPGLLLDADTYVDISSVTADVDAAFLRRMCDGEVGDGLQTLGPTRSLAGLRLGAPIVRPGKIVCIGLNYADHALESGMPIPEEPIVFFKASNTLVGPNDEIRVPRGSLKTDWEVELGVVIGAECRYLDTPEEAWTKIAGFVTSNDVSERAFQLERGGQWVKGKSCETFNPCGPYLATTDEVPVDGTFSMWLDVNGQRMQTGSTATMIFDVPYLIWYLSQFMVLEPGDLINTGTPPGVGMGQTPPQYLSPGDIVQLAIERLGAQRQVVVAAP
jgi:2,4-diketo-3-deoxy-L-fuconate hydrolase